MRKLLVIGALMLSGLGCGESAMQDAKVPVVEPDKPMIVWLHPLIAKPMMENNCFIIKFYSDDVGENELLDELLSDEDVINKINSSYIPVEWDNDFADRDNVADIDDSWAGIMALPLAEDVQGLLLEVDSNYQLPPDASSALLEIFEGHKCNKLNPSGSDFNVYGL